MEVYWHNWGRNSGVDHQAANQNCKSNGIGGDMLRGLWCTCAFAGCVLTASVPSGAQEVIHALTGTVSAINETTKTITVLQDNGSNGVFQAMSDPKKRIAFDKRVADETTAAREFNKSGAYAIIFYFGGSENPTAVVLKSLGAGPFESTVGTVTKVEGHKSITVVDNSGALHTFKIDKDTVAEGGFGAVVGEKFSVNKGDQVRVVSGTVGGESTALFMRDM